MNALLEGDIFLHLPDLAIITGSNITFLIYDMKIEDLLIYKNIYK